MPTAFRLAAYLLLAQLAGFALLLWFWPNWPLALGLALGVALVLLWPVLRTVQQVEEALEQLTTGHPPTALPTRWHGPLARLVTALNTWLTHAQATAALREALLSQTRDSAAQQERNRLARELHDSIKQQLFTINVSAAAVQAHLAHDPARAGETLADVRRAAQEALAEMNALLQQLAPAPLEKVGLLQALRDQCEALGYRTGAQVQTDLREVPEGALPSAVAEGLFRVAQEALSNIARHARARTVRVTLQAHPTTLCLEIADDGQGFVAAPATPGMGLANMRARLTALQGQLTVASTAAGTTVRAWVPLLALEAPMLTNHVLNKVFLTGALGGLGLLALLAYPLMGAPAPFVAAWPPSQPVLSLLLQVLAVAGGVAVGYGAARWGQAATRPTALWLGAVGGALAGLVVFGGLGSAWLGVAATSDLLTHGLRAASDHDLAWLMIESLHRVFWFEQSGFWLFILGGLGLGGLGGYLAPLRPETRTAAWVWFAVPTVLVAAALAGSLCLVVTFVLYSSLDYEIARISATNALTLPPLFNYTLYLVLGSQSALYLGPLLALAAVLRRELRLSPPTDALTRARLNTIPPAAYLTALLAFGMVAFGVYLLQQNPHARGSAQLIFGLTLLGSAGLGARLTQLGFRAQQHLQTVGLAEPPMAPNRRRDLWAGLAVVGPVVWFTMFDALQAPWAFSWLLALVALVSEFLFVGLFLREWRKTTPSQLAATPLVAGGTTMLLGATLVTLLPALLFCAPALTIVLMVMPFSGPLAGDPVAFTLVSLVRDYYTVTAQGFIILLALLFAGAGIGGLATSAMVQIFAPAPPPRPGPAAPGSR